MIDKGTTRVSGPVTEKTLMEMIRSLAANRKMTIEHLGRLQTGEDFYFVKADCEMELEDFAHVTGKQRERLEIPDEREMKLQALLRGLVDLDSRRVDTILRENDFNPDDSRRGQQLLSQLQAHQKQQQQEEDPPVEDPEEEQKIDTGSADFSGAGLGGYQEL